MAASTTQKTEAALEKKVRAAIADLEKDGKRATNAAVRYITKGSFRDVGPLVKAVLAEKEAHEKAAAQVPPMPEEITDLATALWEGAYRHADEAAATARRAHAELVSALREEIADREDEVGIVEDERDVAIQRAKVAEAKLEHQAEDIQALKLTIAVLEGRLQERSEAAHELRQKNVAASPESEISVEPAGSIDDGGSQEFSYEPAGAVRASAGV